MDKGDHDYALFIFPFPDLGALISGRVKTVVGRRVDSMVGIFTGATRSKNNDEYQNAFKISV
jgi:hypothetical protein